MEVRSDDVGWFCPVRRSTSCIASPGNSFIGLFNSLTRSLAFMGGLARNTRNPLFNDPQRRFESLDPHAPVSSKPHFTGVLSDRPGERVYTLATDTHSACGVNTV